MKRRALSAASILASLALLGACGSPGLGTSGSSSTTTTTGSGGSPADPQDFASVNASCAYQCPVVPSCSETTAPYACQNLGAWAQIPHDTPCEAWDGTYPKVVQGACTATVPSGEAVKLTAVDPANPAVRVLPDGRRLSPAGADFVFTDPETMTANVAPIAGTSFLLTLDLGYGDHIVRAVDPSKVAAQAPVLGQVNFQNPESLNQGIAFSPPDRVYVASAQGVVQAIKIDTTKGALTRDDARSITLPASPSSPGGMYYASGVAVSADNTKLFVSAVKDTVFYVADITAGGPTYGTVLGQVDLGAGESFNVYLDPNDPTTHYAYVTLWGSASVLEIDVSNAAAPRVSRSFSVEKDPQGMAFLDARWAVAGNDLGDTLSILDRTSGTVTTVPVGTAGALHGVEPSSLAFDPAAKRLYVTHAAANALAAYDVDLTRAPPTITPAGRLPTQWWPSGVAVLAGGSLAVTSVLGHGTGPRQPDQEYEILHGGIQIIPAPSAADLSAGEATVAKNNAVSSQSGYAEVQCPAGASDFPVPPTNTGKPSPVIDQLFFVIRENKTFEGLLGDLPGITGDPANTLEPTTAQMDGIFANLRDLARAFSHSDNFYTSAFISNQGHVWTTYGRTNDFNEREWWVTGYGRNLRGVADSGGVTDLSRPVEGSLFDWLGNNNVPYDILGEIVGEPGTSPAGHDPFDARYPGGFIQSIGYPDVEKGCYVAGRARVLCDLGNVVYMTLPNDHTQGVSPTVPTPETMFAVNDEATGMLVDGISHSPRWKRSLVVIVEDDPSMGGESVDYHRTVLVMASPWVKRGYVSHAHVDIASIHKIIAHVFALPYPNQEVASAALPLDMFTSTPDYTPYTYEKRTYPLACGTAGMRAEQRLTESWDFDDPDEQPGLDAQVMRWLRGQQLSELPPKLEREVAAREAARARRRAAGREDER